MFETENADEPNLVANVAKLVFLDDVFNANLAVAISNNISWLYILSGIMFRFYSLNKDGGLLLTLQNSVLLEEAIEAIITPFERGDYQALTVPHALYGALYKQVVTLWLAAHRRNAQTRTLRHLARRLGRALVKCFYIRSEEREELRKGFKQQVSLETMSLSHDPIRGSRRVDIVFQAFMA